MIPMEYDFLNIISGQKMPGVSHASDNATAAFFRRYFLQKAVSVFDMDCPPEWPKNFFWYVLYACGYIAVLDVPGYGVIPQFCTLAGRNVFYQPAEILVANPAIKPPGTIRRTIGQDCVLLQLTPDYGGIADIIWKYADLMAVTAEALGVNMQNSKLAYVFASSNKAAAETFKKVVDKIQAGQPAVIMDKMLFNEQGEPTWMTFSEDLRANFIAPDLLDAWSELEHRFDQEIGIPNTAGSQKKERLVVDEVNMNNASTYSKAALWLESLQDGAEKVRKMYGTELSFRWRMEVKQDAGNTVNAGTVSEQPGLIRGN